MSVDVENFRCNDRCEEWCRTDDGTFVRKYRYRRQSDSTSSGKQDVIITAQATGYMDHHLVGTAQTDGFKMVSLIASRSTTSQVYSMLGISVDESKGVLIVALDDQILLLPQERVQKSPRDTTMLLSLLQQGCSRVIQSNLMDLSPFQMLMLVQRLSP